MSFIQRTLKKAEDFLDSFDENVANYSRKVALSSSEWEQDETDNTFTLLVPPPYKSLESSSSRELEANNCLSTQGDNTQKPTTAHKNETDDEFTDIAFVTEDSKVVSSLGKGVVSDSGSSNEYKNQLAQVTRERNSYAKQLLTAKKLLEELQSELSEERKRSKRLEEEKDEQIMELERNLNKVEWQLQQLGREKKDEEDAYQLALAERDERIQQLMEEWSMWQERTTRLQEELERKSQEHQDLSISVHEEITRLSEALEKEKMSHQATRSSYQEKVHEWETQLFTFQQKEAQLEKDLFAERQENKSLATKVEELEYQLELERNRCTHLQQQLDNVPKSISTVDTQQQVSQELYEKIYQLEKQVTTLEQEKEAIQRQAMMTRENVENEAKSTCSEYQESIQLLQGKLKQMADSLLEKQNQIESLRSTARVLSSQLDTERRRASQLEALTADSMQRNNTFGFSTIDGNMESSNYRPLRIRRAPRIVEKFLKVLDRFFALCLLILRREPLVRLSLFVYIVLMNILLFSSHPVVVGWLG